MERPCDQFLPRAAFSGDENRRFILGHFFDHLENLLDRLILTDDVFKAVFLLHLLPEELVLFSQPFPFLCLSQGENNLVRFERLGDIIVSSQCHSLDGDIQGSVGGHHNDRCVGPHLLNFSQELQPIHLGHSYVAEDLVEGRSGDLLQSLRSIGRRVDFILLFAQDEGQHVSEIFFIVNDKNTFWNHFSSCSCPNKIFTAKTQRTQRSYFLFVPGGSRGK